jgi:hypothetical protein
VQQLLLSVEELLFSLDQLFLSAEQLLFSVKQLLLSVEQFFFQGGLAVVECSTVLPCGADFCSN